MEKSGERKGRIVGGIALILFGVLALVAQFVELEWLGLLILPALGLIFFAWGIVTRASGLFIPAGILSGLGIGTLLLAGPFADLPGEKEGAIFMLVFAFGWVLIPIFSTIFTGEKHLWALIPAAIIALIGASLLFGSVALTALSWLGRIWPIFLILGGLYVILRQMISQA